MLGSSAHVDTRYGYRPGVRQPSHQVNVTFTLPVQPHSERVDRWLREHFGLAPLAASAEPAGPRLSDFGTQVALGCLEQVLATYRLLGRASRWPIHERGRVIDLERRSDRQWQCRLLLPAMQTVGPRTLEQLLRDAFLLVERLRAAPPSAETARQLYAEIESSVLPRYTRLFSVGDAGMAVSGLAHRLDVPVQTLGMSLLQLGWGARAQVTQGSACADDSVLGARLCTNKFVTARRLKQAGMPVPGHVLVGSFDDAVAAAARLGWPVVVKPVDRERGEGVTIDVGDVAALRRAFDKARALSGRVLVERQAPGLCHRVFVAGGRLVFAVGRRCKSVRGDGASTVRQLVEAAEVARLAGPPWWRDSPYPMDDLALECLARSGLDPNAVPGVGQLVPLRPFQTTEWGGVSEDATGNIHPENVSLALRAARLLGLSVAGVDMITEDISRPWYETGAVINEVNYRPYFLADLRDDKRDAYLRAIVQGDGRIPVQAVIGSSDLWRTARRLRDEWLAEGTRAHLCGRDRAEAPDGACLPMSVEGLFDRCMALLRLREVEALIIVVDSFEFLDTGLPVDRIQAVHVAGTASGRELQRLRTALAAYLPGGAGGGRRLALAPDGSGHRGRADGLGPSAVPPPA